MRAGRTEQTVFALSVLGRIKEERKYTLTPLSEACGAAVLTGSGQTVISAGNLTEQTDDGCYYVFYRAMNRMAAARGEALAVTLNMIMPEGTDQDELKGQIDRLASLAKMWNIDVADVRSGVSSNVLHTIFSVTCIGRLAEEYVPPVNAAGLSVIMTKYAGCEGTSILAHNKYETLRERFSRNYLEEAAALKEAVPAVRDAQAAVSCGAAAAMFAAGEGGILSALWDLSAGLSVGFEIDLRAVPVRQETVEICEALSLNPYGLHAGGSLLILTDEEEKVIAGLENAGIPCAVIGRTRSDQKKLLRSGEAVQCMNRPSKDALLAINE